MWNRLAAIALFGLLILAACVITPRSTSGSLGISGYDWLSWSTDARQFYILAFVHAYHKGFREGCMAANEIARPKWTIHEIGACEEKQLRYARDIQVLVREVSDFYQQYPGDRGLELSLLLEQLSDQKHKSANEIHALVKSD